MQIHFRKVPNTYDSQSVVTAPSSAGFGICLLVCTISATLRVLPVLSIAAVGFLMAAPRESRAGSAVAVGGAIAALNFVANEVIAPLAPTFWKLDQTAELTIFWSGLVLTMLFQICNIQATMHIASYLGLNAVSVSCQRLKQMAGGVICLLIFALGFFYKIAHDESFRSFSSVLVLIGVIGVYIFALVGGFMSYFRVCGAMIRELQK